MDIVAMDMLGCIMTALMCMVLIGRRNGEWFNFVVSSGHSAVTEDAE